MNDSKPNSPPIAVPIDPRKGFPLQRATGWYGNQEMAKRCGDLWLLSKRLPGGEADFTPEEWVEYRSFRTALREDLVLRLLDGTLIARGFRHGELEMAEIPPAWWRHATIDWDANAAEAHGIKLAGIQVYPGLDMPEDDWEDAQAESAPSPHSSDSAFAESGVRQAFADWIGQLGRNPTQRECEEWAKGPPRQCSRDFVRELFQQLGPHEPGRPRNERKIMSEKK